VIWPVPFQVNASARPSASVTEVIPYPPELSAWVNRYTVSFLSVSLNPPDTGARVANRPGGGEYDAGLLPGLRPNATCCPSG